MRLAAFDPRGRPQDRTVYRWLAQSPPGAVLELPILSWGPDPTLTYQYATLIHGHPIVNGYSGYGSALQTFLGGGGSPLRDFDRMGPALTMLRSIGIRYVIVHPRDHGDPNWGAGLVAAIRSAESQVAEEMRFGGGTAFRLHELPATSIPTGIGPRIDSREFRASASDGADRLPLAFDGNPDTRWLSNRPQRGDEWIRIDFDRVVDVARVGFAIESRSFGDYPRGLVVESLSDGESEARLFEGDVLVPLGRAVAGGVAHPSIDVDLPPNATRTLMIRQTGQARPWFWSIHELTLWER
jgi:hypothetical protein